MLYQAKVGTASKVAQEDEENSNWFKEQIQQKNELVEQLKVKEQDYRIKLNQGQQEFVEMDEKQEQILRAVELENRDVMSKQQEEIGKLQEINGDQMTVLTELKER